MPGQFPAFVIQDVVSGDTIPFPQTKEIEAGEIRKFVRKYFQDSATSRAKRKVW